MARNRNSNTSASARKPSHRGTGTKARARMTALELTRVSGGKQGSGDGNTSIWGKMKSIMFGVHPDFYD